MLDHLSPLDAVQRAAHELGQAVELLDRYDLGAEGAYRVRVEGSVCVFKYWAGQRAAALDLETAVAIHAVLRQCGWPVPRILFWHASESLAWTLEQRMPGQRTDTVSESLCQIMLDLLAAVPVGAGGGIGTSQPWVAELEASLYDELPLSPCRPHALQQTVIGRRIVKQAREALHGARPALTAAQDAIHADFSGGNILCTATGAVSAVLDWQHARVGHRAFDLVGLEWDLALRLDVGSAPALSRVTAMLSDQVDDAVRTFCRAYYAVWNLSWALGTDDEEAVLRAARLLGVV